MNPMDRAQQEALLSDNVYRRLKDYILSDAIRPPDRLQIGQLSRHFGVSITPIREALIRLSAENIVDSKPARGFFYKEFIPSEQIKTYEILFCLLKYALETCGPTPPEIDIDLTQPTKTSLSAPMAGPSAQVLTATLAREALYQQIAAGMNNQHFVELVQNLCERTRFSRLLALEQQDDHSQAFEDLRKQIDLVRAGETRQLMEQLRERFNAKAATMHALANARQHRIYNAYPLLRPDSAR